MILVGPLVYRANSYLFQFCCACVCLCLHLVWCTGSASPRGTFSLQITHDSQSIFNSVQLGVLIFYPPLPPQFDILPLCTVLHQQSVGCPLSGYRSCSNTSQSHHQGQKEELRHPSASVSQLNPGADGPNITAVADFWYISTQFEKCYILYCCILYTDLEFDCCRNHLHSTD